MAVVETAQRVRAASLEEIREAGRVVVGLGGHTICLLADGDEVVLRADGLGEVRGRVQAAA